MSLREKAREVKAAGEAERGDFDPQGKPLELYMQWRTDRLRRNKEVPSRENFCHFWRVVAIWVPLMKVRPGATALAEHPASGPIALAVLIAAVVVGVVTGAVVSQTFLEVVLTIASIMYFITGLFAGGIWATTESDDPEHKGAKIVSAFTFPVAVPVWAIASVINRIPRDVKEFLGKGIIGLAIAFGLFVICGATISGLGWGWGLLAIVAVPAGVVAVIFACVLLSDYVKGVQIRRETAAAAEWHEEDFDIQHVDARTPREPGKVSKFFSAIADFIVLIAQVVRTKKWKICPLVTIPEDEAKVYPGAPEWS